MCKNNNEDIKEIQKKILEIFIEIDKVCITNNLRYFAIGGTCLGAVRHQGFIPWDDDMDIAMPREDYERFKKIASKLLPSNLRIFDYTDGEHFYCKYMKVHDIHTTLIEKGMLAYPDSYSGIYIDIMPLDGIPNGIWNRKIYFLKLSLLRKLDWRRKYEYDLQADKKNKKKIFLWRVIYFFIKRYPIHYFHNKYVKLQKKYAYNTSKSLCYTWSWRASKVIFPKEDFDNYILLPFEDVQMRCPVGYDNFLKTLFGDYMKLPPIDKQNSHHEIDILDLERPFTYYYNEGRTLK